MSIDFIMASLPALKFGEPAPLTAAAFRDAAPQAEPILAASKWPDLETQLRNAVACARHGERDCRPAVGCSLYWRRRVAACFQETDPFRRDEALDRVWWDAAGELTAPSDPLGTGALATYAVRLRLALKRSALSAESGRAAFDRLTAETRVEEFTC